MKFISTNKAPAAVGPYSQAVETNGLIFVSGQIPLVAETKEMVKGDIKAATRQSLENCQAILQEAGINLGNVVKVTVLLNDISDFAEMNEVYASFFGTHKPARAAFEVSKLPLGADIEIEMIAAR